MAGFLHEVMVESGEYYLADIDEKDIWGIAVYFVL